MVHLGFWLIWLLAGFLGANAWLGTACPPGGCSFLLVLLQLPELVLPMFVWLIVGAAISGAIATRKAKRSDEPSPVGKPAVQSTAHSPVVLPSASDDDLMKAMNITFDGKQYQFNGYRYDKLSDAVSYAKQVAGRGNA
jgi:hypothetical protein